MSVIGHWIASYPAEYERDRVIHDERSIPAFRNMGWTVTGPYVLAEQLEGAVGALEKIDVLLDAHASREGYAGHLTEDLAQIVEDGLAAARGSRP